MPINQREKDYDRIITSLFNSKFKEGSSEIDFTKDELVSVARKLKITLRNPPDVVYTYRSRANLPEAILDKGNWVIKPKGKGRFSFLKSKRKPFVDIQEGLHAIEIPNALPEIVEKHASEDEQALLSSIRYNRLVDIFTEIACFHLQSHIRTTIEGEGQIEVDDLYVGVDTDGTEYILPLEAKSGDDRDKLGWIQISNMVKFSRQNFPKLKCRPIAAKPAGHNKIYLIEFDSNPNSEEVSIVQIKLYRLKREKKKGAHYG
ncbi:MAG: endonuclease [Ignavibacteriae bacterium]|nr:endonuclease [Ignavibacteriota bacterium]